MTIHLMTWVCLELRPHSINAADKCILVTRRSILVEQADHKRVHVKVYRPSVDIYVLESVELFYILFGGSGTSSFLSSNFFERKVPPGGITTTMLPS